MGDTGVQVRGDVGSPQLSTQFFYKPKAAPSQSLLLSCTGCVILSKIFNVCRTAFPSL